jgi:hypothetical protein
MLKGHEKSRPSAFGAQAAPPNRLTVACGCANLNLPREAQKLKAGSGTSQN